MIFTLCIAFFIIHSGDPLSAKEPALMYLTIFCLLYITGPGKYSIDAILKEMAIKN
jgi:putative oxidoreductase